MKFTTVAINTALWLMVGELVLHPVLNDAKDVTFTRVGAIYPDSARLVVRYPHTNATDATVRILWRQVPVNGEDPWSHGPSMNLTAANDWVSTAPLEGLWPSTAYECMSDALSPNAVLTRGQISLAMWTATSYHIPPDP